MRTKKMHLFFFDLTTDKRFVVSIVLFKLNFMPSDIQCLGDRILDIKTIYRFIQIVNSFFVMLIVLCTNKSCLKCLR